MTIKRLRAVVRPAKTVCAHCGQPVQPLSGRPLPMRGKVATFRHVTAPVGCRKGDPLMDEDVKAA